MRKNLRTRTATTYTVDAEILKLAGPDAAELAKPYVWKTVGGALAAVDLLAGQNAHKVVEHEAPGLKVYAVYRYAHRNTTALVLMSVIEISDDTAARLHTAVRKARPVTITYTKADGTGTVRTIEPHSLRATRAGDVTVKAADRDSGEMRTFRVDRISAYTVHRTAFTVRTEAPAPAKADLVRAWGDGRVARSMFEALPRRVRSVEGFTGRTSPSTLALGPSGWSVGVLLDDGFTHLTPAGTVRASVNDLVLL
jgi:hypothetical protein